MKRNKSRVLSWALAVCMIVSLFPAAVFAAWEHGDKGAADFTKILKGKDGKEYYINENVKTVFYNSDGTKTTKAGNGRTKVRWRYLKISDKTDKTSKYGYCIEFGAGFDDTATYKAADSAKDKTMFQNLSADARKLIGIALCYGRTGSRKPPVSGTNDADYYFATQVLVWEAQQGLRTIAKSNGKVTGTKLAAAHSMPAKHMYNFLKGRPAEKCYKWLLDKVNDHLKVPSFAAGTSAAAPSYTMKYDPAAGKWTVTLTDTGKKSGGIKISASGVEVVRNGHQYTLSSASPIESPLLLSGKNTMEGGGSAGKILVWKCTTRPANQALIMGSTDSCAMYLKVSTETSAQVVIEKKDKETDKPVTASPAAFQVANADTGQVIAEDLKTGSDGKIQLPQPLSPGNYHVREIRAPEGYMLEKEPIAFAVTSSTTGPLNIEQKDLPQKGVIKLTKKGKTRTYEEGKPKEGEKTLQGAVFDILAAENIVTNDGTIRLKSGETADTITTDQEGNAASRELYLGKYNIVEKEAPSGYVLSQNPVPVELTFAGQETALAIAQVSLTNELETGGVEIQKTDVSTGNPLPETGIEILDADKNVLLKTRTDKEGKAVFEKLPAGKYYFREFEAPEGYQIDETPYPFEIKGQGEIVKCEMTNQKTAGQESPEKPEQSPPKPKPDHSPQTGDHFSLWLCLAAVFAAIFTVFLVARRHRRY